MPADTFPSLVYELLQDCERNRGFIVRDDLEPAKQKAFDLAVARGLLLGAGGLRIETEARTEQVTGQRGGYLTPEGIAALCEWQLRPAEADRLAVPHAGTDGWEYLTTSEAVDRLQISESTFRRWAKGDGCPDGLHIKSAGTRGRWRVRTD